MGGRWPIETHRANSRIPHAELEAAGRPAWCASVGDIGVPPCCQSKDPPRRPRLRCTALSARIMGPLQSLRICEVMPSEASASVEHRSGVAHEVHPTCRVRQQSPTGGP
jgi:hypothetical protein